LGASLVEVHLTLRRADGGEDSEFSLEPEELAEMISGCRTAWIALGQVSYALEASEKGNKTFRRSLYAVQDIPAGGRLTAENIRSIRPGHGLPPKHLPEVLGRRAGRAIARGTPLSWSLLEPEA